MKWKCSVCGCEEHFRVPYVTGEDVDENLDAYACVNCLRVEFFATKRQLAEYLEKGIVK